MTAVTLDNPLNQRTVRDMNKTTRNEGHRLTELRTGSRAQPIPPRKERRQSTRRGKVDAALREYR